MKIPDGLMSLLKDLMPVKNLVWGRDSSQVWDDKRQPADDLDDGEAITSLRKPDQFDAAFGLNAPPGGYHAVALDLDVPAFLVESSTPGHSHLYIDARIPWEQYRKLLECLADCGVIEQGYRGASIKQKCTTLRLPWIRKGAEKLSTPAQIEQFLAEPDPKPAAF